MGAALIPGGVGERDRERLLTVVTLYFLPVAVGLRTPSLGPNYLLMLGLTTIVVSKVLHLREAVLKGKAYPPGLMMVDLALIFDMTLMFQCLARPDGAGLRAWTWAGFTLASAPTALDANIRVNWITFWAGGVALFGLIFLWTIVTERTLRLTREGLLRYLLGWGAGGIISLIMLARSIKFVPSDVFFSYSAFALVGFVLPAWFLWTELREQRLFVGPQDAATPAA